MTISIVKIITNISHVDSIKGLGVFIIKLYTLLNAKIKNRNNSDESSLAIYHIHRDKEEKKLEKVVKRVILLYVPDADLICSI